VEMKRRDRTEREVVPFDQIVERVRQELVDLEGQIQASVQPVAYNE
jgi:hypothetical protein